MKKSVLYGILTLVFVVLTVIGVIYVVGTGAEGTTLWAMAPCAAALVCSNLALRARREGK